MLLPVAVLGVWAGGGWFLALVTASAVVVGIEWASLCGARVLTWPGAALPVGLAVAAICAGRGQEEAALAVLGAGWALLLVSDPVVSDPVVSERVGETGTAAALERAGQAETPERDASRTTAVPGPGPAAGRAGEGAAPPAKLSRHAAAREAAARAGPHRFSRHSIAFGFLYLGPTAVALAWLRADPAAGFANTLFMLAIVWGSDIGAYATGRLFGGPKLVPSISPGKTRSGAAGGLVSAALAGLGVAACLSPDFSSSRVVAVALGLGLAAQAGDLFESALKRDFGVKDSGRIIPGHGGLLDRVDALLAVAPAAALLATTVGRGVVLWR